MKSITSARGEALLKTILLLTIALFVAFVAVTAFEVSDNQETEAATIDGISYTLDSTSKTATVTSCNSTTVSLSIPSNVMYEEVTYTVTSIISFPEYELYIMLSAHLYPISSFSASDPSSPLVSPSS